MTPSTDNRLLLLSLVLSIPLVISKLVQPLLLVPIVLLLVSMRVLPTVLVPGLALVLLLLLLSESPEWLQISNSFAFFATG